MGWSTHRPPRNPKYRTPEHLAYRATLVAQLKRDGHLTCTASTCDYPTRAITNPNGADPDGLNAGHNDDGVTYAGPQHRSCNIRDGSKRARARQGSPRRWSL